MTDDTYGLRSAARLLRKEGHDYIPDGLESAADGVEEMRANRLTASEASIALGWCDVVDANSPLEPEAEEAALIAKLRRIADAA